MDPFDKHFSGLVPGTTRSRSDKALGRKAEKREPPVATDELDLSRWDDSPLIFANVEYFRIGDIARALDVSVQAIRKWEREGRFPEATVRRRSATGHRLYTRQQVETAVDIIRNKYAEVDGRGRVVLSSAASAALIRAWQSL